MGVQNFGAKQNDKIHQRWKSGTYIAIASINYVIDKGNWKDMKVNKSDDNMNKPTEFVIMLFNQWLFSLENIYEKFTFEY